MEGFVAPTSSPCVVDLHEEVFDFSCYLDDTEKVVDTILSMTPPSQLNTAYKSVKMHLKAARELGLGQISHLVQHWWQFLMLCLLFLCLLVSLSLLKGNQHPLLANTPQTQIESEPPTKGPKVTGKAIPTAKPPQGAPGSSGFEEGEIPADTQEPLEEGAVGGPVVIQGQQIVLINLVCFCLFITTNLTIISNNYMNKFV